MLKKPAFLTRPTLRAKTRFSPGGVLVSLRGSTYRVASSLAAALLDDLFEHPLSVQRFMLHERRFMRKNDVLAVAVEVFMNNAG